MIFGNFDGICVNVDFPCDISSINTSRKLVTLSLFKAFQLMNISGNFLILKTVLKFQGTLCSKKEWYLQLMWMHGALTVGFYYVT